MNEAESGTGEPDTAPAFAATIPAQTYEQNTAITPLTLPFATGGNGAITYTLTGPNGMDVSELPDGLTYAANARTITGTPSAPTAAPLAFTWTAADTDDNTAADDTATLDLQITVNEAESGTGEPDTAPAFGETVPAQTYEQNTAITPLTLPLATGGNGAITYTLTGPNGMDVSELPDGLTYAANARTITGTPTTTTAAPLAFTWTAADTDDNTAADDTATLDFTLTVNEAESGTGEPDTAPAFTATISAQTYEQNTAITPLTLPLATGGNGAITYTLTGPNGMDVSELPTGLTYAANARTITGTPTATTAAPLAFTWTAADTDDNTAADDTATLDLQITVNEAESGTGEPDTAPALNATGDQAYTIGRPITALTLPAATGGTGTLTYTLTGPNSRALSVAVPGLTFTATTRVLSGTPTTVATTPLTYTVTDGNGSTAMDTFTVAVAASVAPNAPGEQTYRPVVGEIATFTAINKVILPEATRAMADSSTSSIARRVEQAATDTESATLTLNGRALSLTTLARAGSFADALDSPGVAETLTAAARGLADGSWQSAQLFGNSSFVLPLNAGGGRVNRLMLWGRGDYRGISGKSGEVDWDGTLISGQLGADAQITDAFLAGLTISRQSGAFNYTGTMRGAYDVSQTSIHPYLGWAASDGRMDAWVTLGYGQGAVEIDDQDAGGSQTADLTTRTSGGGGSAMMLDSYTGTLRLKGEILQTQADVDGNATGITALNVKANRIRLTLEGAYDYTLANGAFLRPTVEVGLRHDTGDGKTGTGTEVGGSLHFTHPARRLILESRWRALLAHTGDYGDWGISGMLQFKPGTDGQGLSFSLSPGYGDSTSGIQQLWRHGLAADDATAGTDETDDYALKLDARMGYGVAMCTGEGVLTPYGEITHGTTDSYRVGVNWKSGKRFDLTLLSERREPTTDAAEHAVLLKGEVRF